jgi:photosystem II stability/assembly factor-like uncharacterized protein
MTTVALLVATRKGGFILRSDDDRRNWSLDGPFQLGNIVNHMVLDPRDGRTLLMAARTGHLGPTILRSHDLGRTWTEVARPPAFPRAPAGVEAEAVSYVFCLQPGHASEPGVWYAGTSPHGLFRSEDGGNTWQGMSGFNDNPMRKVWSGELPGGPPGGPTLHSLSVDPRDARHLLLGLSMGGVFESTDRGGTWLPLNRGLEADFLADPDNEYGHDPHCVVMHRANPDRLYQQNHCGIYRMDRPDGRWVRIGQSMPPDVGDIGFAIVAHPRDVDTAWVWPFDGTDVWSRVNPGGKAAAYVTRDGGRTWDRLDQGLPQSQAWFGVKRQALAVDAGDPIGLYAGTTNGQVFACLDGGRWQCLVDYLPEVLAVETASIDATRPAA